MEFFRKLSKGSGDQQDAEDVVIVLLGDSVTQGCFECFTNEQGVIEPIYDTSSSYGTCFQRIIKDLYPSAKVRFVNSGISGDSARGGLARLQRDVLDYHPDLTIVSFGLNDSGAGEDGLEDYALCLEKIFCQLLTSGSDVVFLSPNLTNTYVPPVLTDKTLRDFSERQAKRQNDGIVDRYFQRAGEVAKKFGIPVCDGASFWKKLSEHGVDTTKLLANGINHPNRNYHKLLAFLLLETLLLSD